MAAKNLLRVLSSAAANLPGWPARRRSGHLPTGWRVYLVRTITGELGPQVDPVTGSWAIELNGTESGQLTIRKAELARLDRRWFAPWWASVLFTYTFDGVERPIVGGPVTSWASETDEELVLDFAGPRRILDARVARREGAANADLIVYRDMSRGAIMWALVKVATAKPGGGLPIVHGSPSEAHGVPYIQLEAWNLSSASIGRRLQELSDDSDGPDVMLRPRWANGGRTAVEWALVHGTTTNPTIAQDSTPDWDTTSARANVSSVSVRSAAEHLASRVWVTGAGEGAGTTIAAATDLAVVDAGGPFLEAVASDANLVTTEEAKARAAAELAAREDMLDQVTLGVRANDPKAPLGTWHVGDKGNITLAGWFSIPDGTRQARIIRATGGLTDNITLEFQEDAW